MNSMKKATLVEMDWPEFGTCPPPKKKPVQEYMGRLESIYEEMNRRKLTHLVIYGDREHFANVAYTTGFDPRFEETILILSRDHDPLILVGNECESYLTISPLYNHGVLKAERYQTFSLLNQPRDESRPLREILAEIGINKRSLVGCIGWKYFSESEFTNPIHAVDIPSYIVDLLRELAGYKRIVNATDLFMHPDYGLRAVCSIHDVAYFEYTNIVASEGVKKMLFGMRDGMVDHDVVKLAEYSGEPLGCHMTFITSSNRNSPLSGPIGARITKGSVCSTNVCLWGANCCRAGWIVQSAVELPTETKDYIDRFVGPYFVAVNEWFKHLRVNAKGGDLWTCIHDRLPYSEYEIYLNPGHLIHLDEWVSSPIYAGSKVLLRSGMLIQVDIIPSSNIYFSTRVEDGVLLADENLRNELKKEYPECYSRCIKRKKFMIQELEMDVPEDVLPLSNMPGIIPPFFLDPRKVMILK
jgi:Xaa-Pro aminopeptidase